MLTSVGTEVFIDSHQIRRCSPRPTSRPLPGASFFHLRIRSRSPAPHSAGALPPALVPARLRVRGPATASLPRRFGPRVQLFLREKLSESVSQADSAAGLRGSDTHGETRPPRLHQDLRRRRSCVDPGKKSCASLGRGICQSRIQCPAPEPRSRSPSVSKPKSGPRRPRLLQHRGHASSCAATPPRCSLGHVGAGPERGARTASGNPRARGRGPGVREAGLWMWGRGHGAQDRPERVGVEIEPGSAEAGLRG